MNLHITTKIEKWFSNLFDLRINFERHFEINLALYEDFKRKYLQNPWRSLFALRKISIFHLQSVILKAFLSQLWSQSSFGFSSAALWEYFHVSDKDSRYILLTSETWDYLWFISSFEASFNVLPTIVGNKKRKCEECLYFD